MSVWKLTVINSNSEGVLCMAPNGDTQWLTNSDYSEYLLKKGENSPQ
jgi:hypothetical protein